MSARDSEPGSAGDGGGAPAALRVVATASSEPEAELIRQRLEAEGIAVLIQRTTGNAEFGPSGSRYVYVQAADLERARTVLEVARESP
jgi:hypothetical protein